MIRFDAEVFSLSVGSVLAAIPSFFTQDRLYITCGIIVSITVAILNIVKIRKVLIESNKLKEDGKKKEEL